DEPLALGHADGRAVLDATEDVELEAAVCEKRRRSVDPPGPAQHESDARARCRHRLAREAAARRVRRDPVAAGRDVVRAPRSVGIGALLLRATVVERPELDARERHRRAVAIDEYAVEIRAALGDLE